MDHDPVDPIRPHTHSSWISQRAAGGSVVQFKGAVKDQVEGFFGILTKQSLSLTNFLSKKALRDHIEAYIAGWNSNPTPFVWTKPPGAVH